MSRSEVSWDCPPDGLTLGRERIHVWLASVSQPTATIERYGRVLSKQEAARAARIRFDRHRQRHIVTHGVLRFILSRYLDTEPDKLAIEHGFHSKPYLADQPHEHRICFNVSHSGELVLFALGLNREVGVDIERVCAKRPVDEIVERFFSPWEVSRFKSLPEEQRTDAFFDCWTLKEAYLKATGYGLSRGLSWFSVTFASANDPELVNADGSVDEFPEWSLRRLDGPDPAYKAALASQGGAVRAEYWRWVPELLP